MADQASAGGAAEAEAVGPRRCPQCGRRVAGTAGCPEHGALPEARRGERTSDAGGAELPLFAGLRVTGVLGRGGFGVVYAVERLADGARLALKLARRDVPGAARRLKGEVEALRAVGPPSVPAVHAEGTSEEGAPYVVMERIEAPTLAAVLGASGWTLPARSGLDLVDAALAALEGVHARGLVHADLKPENILIGRQHRAWLLDFGLASSKGEAAPEGSLGAGTPEYMAPEQCDGSAALDARADVYAMGVLLYEVLTGRPPFWGPAAAVREAHRSRRPAPPSGLCAVSPAVEEVVLRCLAKRPGDRYADARELREALRAAVARGDEEQSSTGPARSGPVPSVSSASLVGGRRRVGLIYFEPKLNPLALQRRMLQLGGELAHVAPRRAVALYSHEVGENPARRALRAAQLLVQEGLCESARVDLAAVHVQARQDGSRRYLSAAFDQADRYPGAGDPAGVLLTPTAAAVLPEAADDTPPSLPWASEVPGETVTSVEPLLGRGPLLAALLHSARSAAESAPPAGGAADADAGGPAGAAAVHGCPAMVAVVGEMGTGKTRLYQALRAQLRLLYPGARVVALEARDPGAGGTLPELLRLALDLPDQAPADAGKEVLSARLGGQEGAARWPAVALKLGWLPADAPEVAALGAAPGALRAAAMLFAGEALRALAARGGAFVLLDDAHRCDEATLAALEHAALAEGRARLWICAFARSAWREAHPDWGRRAGRREVFDLGPLDPESAATLCRRLLLPVVNVPDAAVRRLVERAEGVPLLLRELVRGLKREGLVRYDARDGARLATDEIERLPDLPVLDWLAEREMDALPPALQAHARLTALLGDRLDVTEISAVIRALERRGGGEDVPLDAHAGVERLVTAGLLVRSGDGRRVRFRHPLLRELLARDVPPALRAQIHLAAVDHYRRAQDGLERLAAHAAAAGLGEEAAAAYLAIGESARAQHDYLAAEIAYSRALEQSASTPAAARRSRGLMRYRLGRYADALDDLAAARAQAVAAGDAAAEAAILLDEATVLDWTGEYRSAEERARAAEAVNAPETSLLAAGRLLARGRALFRADRAGEAAEALQRAAEAAERLGDEGYETLVSALLMLGVLLASSGRLEDGVRAFDEAIRHTEARSDLLHLAPALNNGAPFRGCLGDRARMVADLERSIAIGRELGQAVLELAGQYNLAEYLYLMDDLEAAEPHLCAAAATAEREGGGSRPALILILEARMRLFRGDEAAAAALAAEVRARDEEARQRGAADAALSPSEDVLCAMIELATAGAGDAAWDALEARSAAASVGQERIEVVEARALSMLRRGHRAEAERHLERALDLAGRIPTMMRGRLQRWLAVARASG